MHATIRGNPPEDMTAFFLVDHKDIDLNIKNNDGWTALDLARIHKKNNIKKLLKEKGAISTFKEGFF